jgi:hypothetical protein
LAGGAGTRVSGETAAAEAIVFMGNTYEKKKTCGREKGRIAKRSEITQTFDFTAKVECHNPFETRPLSLV